MAEEMQQPIAQLLVPEGYAQFSLTVTASEFVMLLAQSRIAMNVGATGAPDPRVIGEFNRAISLPPNKKPA